MNMKSDLRTRRRNNGVTKLYRIGELARLTNLSPRTIDYYTKRGLIEPITRSNSNYRYYNDETIERLKRIEEMKKNKYTLSEIKSSFDLLKKVSRDELVAEKLTSLQLLLQQLEREAKEIGPILERLKPNQAQALFRNLTTQGAACIEALLVLMGKGPFM